MKIALVLFAYNRPKYLKKAIKTHIKIPDISYYAFVDKSDKQKEIIEIIHDSHLYDVVTPRQEHYGLNRNIKEGIDWALRDNEAVIVLEDDLLLTRDALWWLEESLHFWDTVSLQKPDWEYPFRCWGWGMWKSTWESIDWSLRPKEKNRGSWDVIVNENFKQKKWYCACPGKPKVKHIGWSGVHYSYLDLFSIRRLIRRLF